MFIDLIFLPRRQKNDQILRLYYNFSIKDFEIGLQFEKKGFLNAIFLSLSDNNIKIIILNNYRRFSSFDKLLIYNLKKHF